ncbi:MAG TPA: CsbD family protein [Phenylobacterium sp.]|nr:CsbD family protein [Phenylobacterium sp.]
MHKDQIKGAARNAKGAIEEGVGKAIGNDRLAAKGAANRMAGKVQKGAGDLKSATRSALKN